MAALNPRIIVIAVICLFGLFVVLPWVQSWKSSDVQTNQLVQGITQDYATKADIQGLRNYIDQKFQNLQVVANYYMNGSAQSISSYIVPVKENTLVLTLVFYALSSLYAFVSLKKELKIIPAAAFLFVLYLLAQDGYTNQTFLFGVIFVIVAALLWYRGKNGTNVSS